jgi:hypothetical protein
MLEFDFRNGPLRRKYDGLKYALRGVEDILFELSLHLPPAAAPTAAAPPTAAESTTGEQAEESKDDEARAVKKMRIEVTEVVAAAADGSEEVNAGQNPQLLLQQQVSPEATPAGACLYIYINGAELDGIRQRMEAFDQLRELVIKDSRDVQKLAKQAIFAVIRNQLGDAQKKLDAAASTAEKIMLTVTQVLVLYGCICVRHFVHFRTLFVLIFTIKLFVL